MENTQETSQVKLVSECFIKPKYEVDASNSKQQLPYHYLGAIDLALLTIEPMQKGLLFNTSKDNLVHHDQVQDLLDKLKRSLSLSLVHFYPLAGQLATEKFPDEHACWIYVDCNKGTGARLIHATVDFTVSDILSSVDVHPVVRSFFDLGEMMINHDGHTKPLLSIQVTELVDGVFIGFTLNHSLADGTSLWHFISTLSDIFIQLKDGENNNDYINSIHRQPIYKPFLPDRYGPIFKLPYLEPEEFVTRIEPDLIRERIFRFSHDSIATLKAQANEQCGVDNLSSFQALSGFLWRSITRARKLDPNMDTTCSVVTNSRQRCEPPFAQGCFGNYIVRAQFTCKVGDLMGRSLGWAATSIHQIVKAKDDKAYKEFLKAYVEAPFMAQHGTASPYYKPNSVLIGGSTKFNMYGPEFGVGRALAVLAGSSNKEEGKVTTNPGRGGGGSVDLEVCLHRETMSALESDEEFMRFCID